MNRLYSIIMHDGSRHFGDLPLTIGWNTLFERLTALDGVVITGVITDEVTETWLDFDYAGHHFSINDPVGEFWFFVDDPACPDTILETILAQCEG